MTIEWEPWWYADGNGMRLGFEITQSTVDHFSPDVTWTLALYTQNQYRYYSDSQSIRWFNDSPGADLHFTNNEGTSPVLRDTRTVTYTYGSGEYGYSPGSLHFTAEMNGGAGGILPYASSHRDIPARPLAPPDDPTGATATRNSDAQVTLTWTRHSTTSSPYSSQTVAMRRWDGSTVWTDADWSNVASVSGSATSYTKTGLSANHAYQFRVRAENSNGSSGWSYSNVVFMTPAAPSGVVSVLNTTATAITTTWTDNAYSYPSTGTWTIQRSLNGGAFVDVGTVSSKGTTTFVDNSPGGGTNQYRVACVIGSLQSAYATGNTVSAPSYPAAPTLLAPNGTYVDFVNDVVTFTWQYNAGGTGAAQTHFTIETSTNSGSTWNALSGATDVASGVASFALPAGTLVNGTPYLWRVRTEGIVSAGYGPNSTSASVQGSTKPTVTLTLPFADTHSIPVTAAWTFAQAELLTQIAYQALLIAIDGVTLLEEIDGYDAATTVPFTYPTVTGNSYIVAVRAQSSAGIWSNWAFVTTSFVLFPPAAVVSTGTYQPCQGTVLLHFEPTAAEVGVTVDIESITVERRVEGGDWVVLATGLLIPTDFLDTLPLTHGINEYRITAVSSTPSRAVNPLLEVRGSDGDASGDPLWVWVSYGDNFEFILRVHGDLAVSETTGRLKSTQHFLGRPQPVALVGQNVNRAVAVSGSLYFDVHCEPAVANPCIYDSAPKEWNAAGMDAEVVCYRDYTGRRIFGTVADVTATDGAWPGKGAVSLEVTEVYFVERYVQLVTA